MNVFQNNISTVILTLVLITLPLGFAVNSSSIILFFIFGCYKVISKKEKITFNYIQILLLGFYLLCAISLIWTDNFLNTKNGLIRFLPYLALPIAYTFNNVSQESNKVIVKYFSRSLFLYAFYCFILGVVKFYKTSDTSYLFYHELSNNLFNVNAIYLSVFVSFGIMCFLIQKRKTKFDVFGTIFLSFFLILLSSKIIITVTFLLVGLFFFKKIKTVKIKFKHIFFTLGIGLVLFLASNNIFNRVKVEYLETSINEVLEKKDFGHVYLWTGVGLRVFQLKVFYEILLEQKKYSLGFGLSNSQQSLNKKYTDYNLYPGFLNYNYHNQYIQIVAELGFVGLFFILSLFLTLLRQSIIYKDYFLFYFILLTITVCFTESFLWRQRGMVFFITLALLLYKGKAKVTY
jgi:O-antigen ligase